MLEFLRGTVIGRAWSMIADCAEAFHDQIATHYSAHILAISGPPADSAANPPLYCCSTSPAQY